MKITGAAGPFGKEIRGLAGKRRRMLVPYLRAFATLAGAGRKAACQEQEEQ